MTPKQIAQMLINDHHKIGRLNYSDAIDCAIVTAQYCQYYDVIIELKYMKAEHQRKLIESNQCNA